MPTATLVGDLADITTHLGSTIPPGVTLRPLSRTDGSCLAQLYLDSYPPGTAATDLADAQAEVEATFNGYFGQLSTRASLVAINSEQLLGCIQVVRRSIWDPALDCPFIIELFVSPTAQHRGVATALLSHSVAACQAENELRIALRTGEGTSPHAHQLYRHAGLSIA